MLRKRLNRKLDASTLIIFTLCIIVGFQYFSNSKCWDKDTKINKDRFRLIIIILSSPDNLKQRNAIRYTWLSDKRIDVKYLFPIGTKDIPQEQQVTLDSENKKFNDLVFFTDLEDSYHTITKKVLQSLIFVTENFDFDFVLKCDDDSYVVVDQVLRELNKWQNKKTTKELYWGFFNGKARIKTSGQWRENEWILCDYYLPYALGGGYVLSHNLVQFITKNSKVLKLYNSEDISVGVWLAPLANIERKHDIRFNTEYVSRGCSNKYIITHKQSAALLQTLHETYESTGSLCEKEVVNRPAYQYNWSVPPSQCCERSGSM